MASLIVDEGCGAVVVACGGWFVAMHGENAPRPHGIGIYRGAVSRIWYTHHPVVCHAQ